MSWLGQLIDQLDWWFKLAMGIMCPLLFVGALVAFAPVPHFKRREEEE